MANLASLLMEGVGFESSSMDMGNYDYSDCVVEETSYVDSAMATLFTDIMEAEQSFMVADVVGAATVIRESRLGNNVDVGAVMEGVFGNALEKIKNGFKKFIAKIKEFYHKVINWFKAMFSNAENFVKNFGTELSKKSAKGFKYSGFKYNEKAGDDRVKAIHDKVSTKINKLAGDFDVVASPKTGTEFKNAIKGDLSADFKEDDNQSVADEIEAFLKGDFSYSSQEEMRKEIIKLYHGGDTEKGTINNFEANSVATMLTFLKSSKNVISKLNDDLKSYDSKVKTVINQLNKLDKLDDDASKNSAMLQNATWLASRITAYLNLYEACANVRINMKKEMSRSWLGVLKKFYNFRPAKESAEVFDPELYATLENSVLFESDDEDDDDDKGEKDTEECTESAIDSILSIASNFSF